MFGPDFDFEKTFEKGTSKGNYLIMKIYKRITPINRRFDFDIGYLKKSPCKTCIERPLFPDCCDTCEILDRIQTKLARGISTTHSHSALEPFAMYLDQRQDK